jgi:antirestriction protein ArdC
MNTYEIVTERIVKLLEQGVIPWRRPWSAGRKMGNHVRAEGGG